MKKNAFAASTTVSIAKSRFEIEEMLTRYKASKFVSGWQENEAVIMFESSGRRIKFSLPLPTPDDKMFSEDGRGKVTEARRKVLCEQEHRRRWRALCLVIKAKLEAVESGISSFQNEFLANIVVMNGATFGEWAAPQLAKAYEQGMNMPPLLGK
jgi:hypothetical protein